MFQQEERRREEERERQRWDLQQVVPVFLQKPAEICPVCRHRMVMFARISRRSVWSGELWFTKTRNELWYVMISRSYLYSIMKDHFVYHNLSESVISQDLFNGFWHVSGPGMEHVRFEELKQIEQERERPSDRANGDSIAPKIWGMAVRD